MLKRNKVVAGDYLGKRVSATFGTPAISTMFTKLITLDKSTVRSYRILDSDQRKSAVSGIMRALIGEKLFGQAGMIGGTLSAKNYTVYQLAVDFTDGKRSLIEVDDKIYKAIMRKCF